MMKISIVMPCYNAQRWVGEALESIAKQSYQPYEIIVIDDGSTDDSVGVIQANGLDIRLLHTNRAGGAGARNAGIEAATGDWIAFQDADDRWYPNHLERAIHLLQNTDDVGFIALSDKFLNSQSSIIKVRNPWPIHKPTSGLSHETFIEFFTLNGMFTMPTCVARRDRLLAIGMLDIQQTRRHDIDMWLRVIHGHTWAYDPEPSTAYRSDTPGSISRNIANREYFFLRALLKNREGYPGLPMDYIIKIASRRAMSAALTDGNAQDRALAKQWAWGHLRPKDKAVFRVILGFPWLFRWGNLLRRWWYFGRKTQRRGQAAVPAED